jgi:uncharacterized membrane protein
MGKIAVWAILYPIIAHIGIQTSHTNLPVIYLMVLILFFIYCLKIKPLIIKYFFAVATMGFTFLIIFFNKEYIFIQSIPIVVLLTLIYTFFKSLTFGKIPIITQFAECVDEKPLNLDKRKYTRIVTIIWLLGFIYMFIQGIIASIWLPVEVWSWVVNTGNYIVILSIMLGEFLYRNIKFKNDKISFKVFITRLFRCRLRNSFMQ